MIESLAAFLAVSAIVIVAPGQDTALTIRNSLLGGRGAGLATALGVSAGQAVWTLATSAGLAAVLVASEPAFVTLKVVGAAYLVYLGAQSLLSALRGRCRTHTGARSAAPAVAFRQGVLSNLGNPKMAVFGLAGGRERGDPAALAVARETEPGTVDPGLGGEEACGRLGIAGQRADRELVCAIAREDSAGLADALLVVGEHGEAGTGEDRGEIGEVVPGLHPSAAYAHDRRMRPRPRRQGQGSGECRAAAPEAHLRRSSAGCRGRAPSTRTA